MHISRMIADIVFGGVSILVAVICSVIRPPADYIQCNKQWVRGFAATGVAFWLFAICRKAHPNKITLSDLPLRALAIAIAIWAIVTLVKGITLSMDLRKKA